MSILVTGSTGFIGTNLVKFLSDRNLEVTELIRHKHLDKKNNDSNLQVQTLTFSNSDEIDKIFKTNHFDFVINLATTYSPEEDIYYVIDSINSNIIFPAQLIANCIKYEIPFITFGTYLQQTSIEQNKRSFYLESKLVIHDLLNKLAQSENIKYIEIILNDTYGPGDKRSKVLYSILNSLKGVNLEATEGNQLINLLHVNDVCSAIFTLITQLKEKKIEFNATFSVRSLHFYTIRELVDLCEKATGLKAEINWGAREYRGNEIFKVPKLSPILPNWQEKILLSESIFDIMNGI